MSLEGYVEKRSKCCNAPIRFEMSSCGYSCGDSWPVCSQCNRGKWPRGVTWDHVYIPSDYEKASEARIEQLEKRLWKLENKLQNRQ
jgi:hypothetical protein